LSHFSLALIGSRLLASATDPDISSRACALLRDARNLTYRWICELKEKLESTHDEKSCASLRRRLCMLAATCFSTLDVCPEHIPAILATQEDFSIAIQCAVIVHENKSLSLSGDNSVYFTRMISRHRRLLHSLEPTFIKSSRPSAFDHALSRLWLGFRRCTSSSWHILPRPNSRWVSCVAEGQHEVHYDILTGKLLIDGKPLGKLPREIVKHPTYASVLGTVSGWAGAFLTFSESFSEKS
jgi:hypothetical protein